ncbi:efflux RND transporter periplasmic adaptor subunit [Noviherbaspirillum cavernae]|uniref:Efflux RND transporter periplasmic adaptor subunit n=1 Tax=Noviherbaspirillum cavernae TaxID=2320862 RepID=A0A418WY18_9BURK|nr:efflux RND transporter periplasmic adaptor subunit [Noviherbaspirillum cavernae]RJG05128.1 efflux RND transporter periplasmic adaptor subunit [Noviherbaspirillum cavernae]
MNSIHPVPRITAAVLILSALAACGDKGQNGQAQGGGMPPPEVSVVTVAPQRIVMSAELPGRLDASRVAQVRARVPGIVLKRVFREGSDVKAGDVLFRIDPAQYQAAYSSAEATLARAEANLAQATLKNQRYKPLVETNAVSKQEYDDTLTAQKQAAADVAAAKAARETARLNLGYATVNAPISGRVGRALVTEGALVGHNEATPLATIQQLDPIYVNLTQSSSEFLQLQRAMASGQLKKAGKDQARVTLVTEDGRAYAQAGKLLFSDISVDPSSGAVTLRAEFPNPDKFLLPGQYVRAQLEQGVQDNAITVPQQAIQRDQTGASVMLIGADGKVALQPVKTGEAQGNVWIVTEGLKAGDKVIVEGFQKVKPGAPVKAVPWKSSAPNGGTPPQAAAKSEANAATPNAPQADQKPKTN